MARDDGAYAERLQPAEPVRIIETEGACGAIMGPTALQYGVAIAILGILGLVFCEDWRLGLTIIHILFIAAFSLSVIWRGVATVFARPPRPIVRLEDAALPTYTVIAPLYREAAMASGLVAALTNLDYPDDRLQIIIVLEADDADTLSALAHCPSAGRFQILVAPAGTPKTKPRACNIALARATGRHVVVYDAEDRPHRLQLREAAARFHAGGARLACVQAPLRIAGANGFLSRQFALEYAAQFEVILPALARWRAPFPLGGTSNHFETAILKAMGGWDAWNVTEDADLGFRLAAHGWRSDILRTPTWESAPKRFRDWRPQRTRWVKGYMQTWGVHMRRPLRGGVQSLIALQATLGMAILSALVHGPVLVILAATGIIALLQGRSPAPPTVDLTLLTCGWGGAILAMRTGARRAGLRMSLWDVAAAPIYWALQSVAAAFSIIQLITRPHHWDKTRHDPPQSVRIGAQLGERPMNQGGLDGKGAASVRRAA